MARLKPMTPLRPVMQASMKPPSPLLAPEQRPLKPTTPLQPKNTRKTPISHPQRRRRFQLTHLTGPQRRRRFQLKLGLREQRRQGFQTTAHQVCGLPLHRQQAPMRPPLRKLACNSIGTNFNKPRKRCNSNDLISGFERVVGELHAKLGSSTAMCARTEAGPTGGVGTCCGAGGRWRGLAGLRDDAPSKARSADDSRAGRRPPARTAAGPSGARNTRGATSNA